MITTVQRCFFLIVIALALLVSLLLWQMNISSFLAQSQGDLAGMQAYLIPQCSDVVCPPPPVDC